MSKKNKKSNDSITISNVGRVREIYSKNMSDENFCREILENVMFADHFYKIVDKGVMVIPVKKEEKMVDVEIDIDDNTFNFISKEAHRRDVTFNQMVAIILNRYIEDNEKEDPLH